MKIVIISLILMNFILNYVLSFKIKNIKNKDDNNEFIKKLLSARKNDGHYEKYIRTEDVVVFVPGDKPSGIPGAFVVSNEEAQGRDPRKTVVVDPSKVKK